MASVTQVEHEAFSRLAINRIGLWMFFLAETFLFGAVISTRYYILGVQRHDELNQVLGLLITAVLLLSSLTAYMSENAAEHGDERGFGIILLAVMYFKGAGGAPSDPRATGAQREP